MLLLNYRTMSEPGRELAIVTAGRKHPRQVHIWKDDLDLLLDLGLSSSWGCLPSGYVTATASKASGNHIMVARVLLDCGPGEGV